MWRKEKHHVTCEKSCGWEITFQFLEAKARKFSCVSVSLAYLTASCSGCYLVLGIEIKENGYA